MKSLVAFCDTQIALCKLLQSVRVVGHAGEGSVWMHDADAVLVSTEAILFELRERAGPDGFKKMLTLVK